MKHFIQQLITCLVLGMLSLSTAWATEDKTFDASNLWYYDLTVGQTYNITYTNRTFQAGAIETICLPFAISKEQITSTFGEGTTVWEYTAQNEKTAVFSKVNINNGLAAATPYLIKTTKTVTELNFQNVVFALNEKSYNNSNTQTLRHFEGSNYYFYGCTFMHYSYQACLAMSGTTAYSINHRGQIGNNIYDAYEDHYAPSLSANFFYVPGNGAPTISIEGYDPNAGDPPTNPEGGETPTPDDDPDADYSHQNDTNDDGVLEPTAENPAFGVKVNYHKYPQKTDVPTIYITTDANQDISNLYKIKTETYYTANIVVVDKNGKMKQRNEAVTFRGRGNSTWNSGSSKKPWRLKFPSKTKFLAEYDLSAGAEINNYANAKSWTLLSNVYDKSLMRNALTAELGKRYGLEFCPAYRFVDLVINGQYLGTYQVSDQVQVDPKRVNVNSKTGWFVEHSTLKFAEDPYIMPKAGSQDLYVTVKNPETETVTASGESTEAKEGGAYYGMKQWLTQYWTSLKNAPYSSEADKYKAWRDQTDLKSLIGWIIIEDLAGNYDGAMANVYAYKEADASKLKFGPLWDLDLAYGNHNTSGHFWNAQSDGVGFLFGEMFKDPYFVKALYEQWEEFKNGNELSEFISSKVTEISGILAQTQAANYNMPEDSFHKYDSGWKIDGSLTLGSSASSYSAATSAITSYLLDPTNGRISWIETEYKKQYDALGCASLEDIDLDGDDEEGTGGEEGGNTEYVPFESGAGDWGVVDLPANAFPQNAVSAKITVTDARYVLLFKDNDQSKNVYSVEYNDANMSGVNIILTGENLDLAKAGRLSVKAGSNEKSFSLKVTCEFSNNPDTNTPGTDPETPTETFEQLTDLPTMYLQIYKLNEDGTSDKTKTEIITKSGGDYHTARIVIVDKDNTIMERDEETLIRGRGNSTWSGDNLKNPYRLKFPAKTKLLSYLDTDGVTVINNYANAKSWTLLANKGDYSLIRNALTSELGKYLNMPFIPSYKFVDLVVNGSYAGTYQISDQMQVATDRVNVNSDTGWFLSANRGGGYEEDPYFTAGGATFNIKNPEADTPTASGVTTDPKFDAMKTWMTNALQTKWVNEKEVVDGEALSNYFDIESLANFIVGIDITGDPDGAIDNFYMYREDNPSSKMKFGPMWDYDLAYGNAKAAGRDYATKHFFDDESYGWGYKVKQMYNTPTVITAIWKRWRKVYGEYDTATGQSTLTKYLLGKVDELDAIIAQSQVKNFEAGKAGSVAGSNTYSTHADAIDALKAWIPEHIEWLNTAYRDDYAEITGLNPDDVVDDPEIVRAQLTNLPTIYLDAEVGDDWTGASLEVFDSENKLGQGVTWTKTTADVSAQYQGSGDKNKDSYRLKFETKTQLLSSGSFKQWVLLANDDDPTMMRNALAKEMGDALGLPFTPGYQFVDLYVNDVYMGTYQVTDRIKVESGRALVAGGKKDPDWHVRFNDQGEYEEDNPTYYIAGTETMPYIIPKNPDPKDDVTTWNSTLKNDMTTYFNNVFATTDGKYTAFADNVDHQQLIQWYIALEMLCVYKGFSSIEAYRSVTATDQNLHIGVLWDSEKAFGNTGEAPAISMTDLNTADSYNGLMTNYAAYGVMKNIFTQLWQERWFANGVNNLWKEKHEAVLTALTNKATALKTELEDSWAKNATEWNITGEQATSINTMTAWLTERDAYLTKKFAALAAALPCENHTYENNNYIVQADGTYRLGCDVCGTIKEDSETYYKFTVYPESATTTEVFATSWQPSAEHPNSYATVKITPSGAEANISGYNIINTTKNAGGDKTCADFRLTDGHPYYGDDGFVATKATYTRNISNEWGTLCLPFKTQKATSEYADFYHLGSVKNDKENNASTLVFTPVQPEIDGNASAFIPVVFRATAKAKQEGKIVIEATNVSVKKTTGKSFIPTNSTVDDWTLIGTMEQKHFANVASELASGEQLYYIAQNKFWQATTTYTNNPFRAYFIYKPTYPLNAAKSFSIGVDDDTATDIARISNDALAIFVNNGSVTMTSGKNTAVRIYTAAGTLAANTSVAAGECKTINLPSGLYIVNGTKVTVK